MWRDKRWLGFGVLVLGALILLGLGADLIWTDLPSRGGWHLNTTLGALVLLAGGYAVRLRQHRRRLIAVVIAVNALAAVFLGYRAAEARTLQFYFIEHGPVSSAGAEVVRQLWDVSGAGMALWGAVNLLITAGIGWTAWRRTSRSGTRDQTVGSE